MIRYNFYLTKFQKKFLEELSQGKSPISEHIRRAIDEYIERVISSGGVSPSKKVGEQNVSN